MILGVDDRIIGVDDDDQALCGRIEMQMTNDRRQDLGHVRPPTSPQTRLNLGYGSIKYSFNQYANRRFIRRRFTQDGNLHRVGEELDLGNMGFERGLIG